MNLDPLLQASPVIQVHAAAAILAMILGPLSIFRRRRDRLHKITGYVWISAMLVAATSALFITELRLVGRFSPIHLLTPLVYWSIWRAITFVRAGNIVGHCGVMKSLYIQALGIAGLFTLVPGRIMSDVLFSSAPWLGFSVVSGLMVLAYVRALFNRRSNVA
ncbi:MAG: DUF2306 domain-containing protein [Rhodobacteraceae bacterium]|nr:DUF2306 domain-containing protein [Paracoccaceae bacterium]